MIIKESISGDYVIYTKIVSKFYKMFQKRNFFLYSIYNHDIIIWIYYFTKGDFL